ncbi:MAG: phenylacetate--CoA ligase [Candidatus Methanosuratincola sp.]|jgi:phenylacetate-CoA ligase|nr:phenylacetate--CoA ligase [Candidatus Methanosuratincola sp.]
MDEMWNRRLESLDRESIKKIQLERLKLTVRRLYENVPFYRSAFKSRGVSPDDIRSLDDLKRLPMVSKHDLRENYPFGLLAVPREECVRVHASSGTTGKPTLVLYTREDLQNWTEIMCRCLYMSGLRRGDVFQVTPGYGLFTGGLGFHYGGEAIGATVVPTGTGNTERQINLMRDLGTTMIAGIASYALHIAEVASEMGVDVKKDLQVRKGIFGAEAWSDSMMKKISDVWDMDCHDIYGMSEMYGPGVGCNCSHGEGLHIWEDHFIVEIIDPSTGEPLGPEEEGEVVLTSLTKTAMPMLRFRTRDMSKLLDTNGCECGRTHQRIARIKGRCDDAFSINGVKVFPGQVEYVLMKYPEVGMNYQLVVEKAGALDQLTVLVEANCKSPQDDSAKSLEKVLFRDLRTILGFQPTVRVLPPMSIERRDGKARRVLDLRMK